MSERRDRGSGSISRRKDGLWTARISVGTKPDGRPQIKALYGSTEAEVRRKLKDLQKELAKNDGVMVQRTTVSEYMTRWLNDVKANELKPKSRDRLEQTLVNQVFPAIGHLQVAALTSSDVQNMINNLKDDGMSYSTIKKAYNAVNNCFKTGVIQHSVTFNPAIGVTLPRQDSFESDEMFCYTPEEVKRIIAAARSAWSNGVQKYRLGDAVILVLNTGLRTAELLGLRWSHVDFQNRVIRIRETRVLTKQRTPGGGWKMISQRSTKTSAGSRDIHLNDMAYDALCRLREVTGHCAYVCSSKTGEPLHARAVGRMLHYILDTAGIPKERWAGPHTLRHTFASSLFDAGVDIKVISELLGHADVETTYRVYIHLIQEREKKTDAVRKVHQLYSD